jgi:hypothetical protein
MAPRCEAIQTCDSKNPNREAYLLTPKANFLQGPEGDQKVGTSLLFLDRMGIVWGIITSKSYVNRSPRGWFPQSDPPLDVTLVWFERLVAGYFSKLASITKLRQTSVNGQKQRSRYEQGLAG